MVMFTIFLLILSYAMVVVYSGNKVYRCLLWGCKRYCTKDRVEDMQALVLSIISVLLGIFLTYPCYVFSDNVRAFFLAFVIIIGSEAYLFYRNDFEKDKIWMRVRYALEVAIPVAFWFGVIFS